MRRFGLSQLVGPAVATLVVALLVMSTTDRFLDWGNLNNLVLQVSIVAIVAIGATIVIFIGGIDLSPGSMVALLTMMLAEMIKFTEIGFWPAVLATIGLGAVIGAANGVLVAYLRIPSFIATLAGLSAYRGLAFMFNNGSPIFDLSDNLEPLYYGTLFGLPLPLLYLIVCYGAAHWLMRRTRLGRSLYAVGGNAGAALLSGINVRRVEFLAFVIAGLTTAFGAILMAARLNSGSPNYGVGLELQAIAAAVIGGASLAGGRGHVLATLFGALTITIVQNGLNLNAVPASTQTVVIGGIIVLAVAIDIWRSSLGHRFMQALGRRRHPTPEPDRKS
jgi:ribose transport system permease protein